MYALPPWSAQFSLCFVPPLHRDFWLAQQPFLSSEQWVKLRDEASGAAPYENLRYLTRLHRVPATAEFDQAAQFVLQRAREYGLAEVQSEQFPIDGKTQYGLMRSYLGWTVEAGQLWEVRPQHLLLGDWATDPIRLADYSHMRRCGSRAGGCRRRLA